MLQTKHLGKMPMTCKVLWCFKRVSSTPIRTKDHKTCHTTVLHVFSYQLSYSWRWFIRNIIRRKDKKNSWRKNSRLWILFLVMFKFPFDTYSFSQITKKILLLFFLIFMNIKKKIELLEKFVKFWSLENLEGLRSTKVFVN